MTLMDPQHKPLYGRVFLGTSGLWAVRGPAKEEQP